jgi:hypothetical protein
MARCYRAGGQSEKRKMKSENQDVGMDGNRISARGPALHVPSSEKTAK